MHTHSIDDFRHSHVFLGAAHDRNERKTWAVIGICTAMMVAEIIGGLARHTRSWVLLLLLGSLSPAFGKDLNTLIRLLYSAYVAEQGSAMCMVPSIKLSDSDRAVFIDAHNYAQLLKQKISAGLSDDDVHFVLKSAADRAREDMLQVVGVLKSKPPDKEYAELFRWCTNNMKPGAEKLLRGYAEAPDALDKLIDSAKHD
jgi:hypothetical protein